MSDAWREARVALDAIYEGVAADLAARPGLFCELSGRCCRFREAGHQLWLTRLEYEAMVERGGAGEGGGDGVAECPWLGGGRCGNREGRALACRTYFCSDEAQANAVTESWHAEIRRLHERLAIPYDYRRLCDHRSRASAEGGA